MNRIFYILLLCMLWISTKIFALGAFNLFNNRNRPDLTWHEVSTENIRIIYSDNLSKISLAAAAIADSTFQVLVKTYQIKPQKKIIIYLSDQDEITNGATLLDYYIFIWANSNDYPKMFTGTEKWLEKVIPHEMVHWFVAYLLTDRLSLFLPISNVTFPLNMNEGYAQYFSGEEWGYNRGDRYLRTYSLTESQEFDSSWAGGYLYANGFAFVKYLSEFYGEERLVNLLKYRGRWNLYQFEKNFQKIYQKSYQEMRQEWLVYIKTWYYGDVYQNKLNQSDFLSDDSTINSITNLATERVIISDLIMYDDKFIAKARLSKNQGFTSIIQGLCYLDSLQTNNFAIQNFQLIEKANYFIDIEMSSNGNYSVFSRLNRGPKGEIIQVITLRDNITKKKIIIGHGSLPVVRNDGIVFYQWNDLEDNFILSTSPFLMKQENKELSFLLKLPITNQICELRLNPQGNLIAVSIFSEEKEFIVEIYDTKTKSKKDSFTFDSMPQYLHWKDDLHLAIAVENTISHKLDLYLYALEHQNFHFFTSPAYNIIPKKITDERDGLRIIGMNDVQQGRKLLGSIYLPEQQDWQSIQELHSPNYYTKWMFTKPQYSLPEKYTPFLSLPEKKYRPLTNIRYRASMLIPDGGGILGSIMFSEPLSKHFISTTVYSQYRKNEPTYYEFSYINKTLKPTISISSFQSKWFAGIVDLNPVVEYHRRHALNISYLINIKQRSFTDWVFNYGVAYYETKLARESKKYSSLFDEDHLLISSIGTSYCYNLPWRNVQFHPVRKHYIESNYDFSTKLLGMPSNYNQFQLNHQFTFAPLLYSSQYEQINTIALHNNSNYRLVGGNSLKQFLTGVDEFEYIVFNGQPVFHRFYQRGFKETILGKELLSTQTDLQVKLLDQLDWSLNLVRPLLMSSYLGGSLWYDYTRLNQIMYSGEGNNYRSRTTDFTALGWEIKSAWTIIYVDALLRYGRAYKPVDQKYSTYFLIEIKPFFF